MADVEGDMVLEAEVRVSAELGCSEAASWFVGNHLIPHMTKRKEKGIEGANSGRGKGCS